MNTLKFIIVAVLLSVNLIPKTAYADPPSASWFVDSHSITPENRLAYYEALPSGVKTAIQTSNTYLVVQYMDSGTEKCYVFVATSGTLEFRFTTASNFQVLVLSGSIDRYQVTSCAYPATDLSNATYQSTSTGGLGITLSSGSDYFEKVLLANGVTSVYYDSTYIALSPARPQPTASDINQLKIPTETPSTGENYLTPGFAQKIGFIITLGIGVYIVWLLRFRSPKH